jgi:predicted dienelactone hydrolase
MVPKSSENIYYMSKYKYWLLIALLVVTAILTAIDIVNGSYRWQMLPVYISGILLVLVLVYVTIARSQPSFSSKLLLQAIRLGLFGLLTTAILSYLYPVFTFPVPTGPYLVGTVLIDMVDRSRTEVCDRSTNKSPRELVVQFWYPSTSDVGAKNHYLNDPRLIPSGLFSHLGLVTTNSINNVAIAVTNAPYPVVLYSPAWDGFRTDNTFQAEELASHGFVVVGLEHPCSVPLAIYPNGRVIRSNLSSDSTSSDQALTKLLKTGEEQLVLRTQDIQFVLDQLPQLNNSQPFKGILNLEKIGIFGHSFGGAAAAQACSIDPRLKAGMNMDGLLFGSVAQQGAAQPFLFMQSDYPRPTTAELNSPIGNIRRSKLTDEWSYQQRDRWFQHHGGYRFTLLGSAHMNFSDHPLRSQIANNSGPIATDRAMQIINQYTVAFFDQALNGKKSSLLDRQSGSPFSEVVFVNHPTR